MSIFDYRLSTESNEGDIDLDNDNPGIGKHPAALGEEEDPIKDDLELYNKTVEVMESLEAARHTLIQMRENGIQLDNESLTHYSERITMAYTNAGLPETLPVHFSAESRRTKDNVELAIEAIDARLEMLSLEKDNIFRRIWDKMRDIFGREGERVERAKQKIDRCLKRLHEADNYAGGNVFVKNGSALTINGKQDIPAVMRTIEAINQDFINDGKIMTIYATGIRNSAQFAAANVFSDSQSAIKQVRAKNFFPVKKPFVHVGGTDAFDNYQCRISDKHTISLEMPTGLKAMYPQIHTGTQHVKVKKGASRSLHAPPSKEEMIRILTNFGNIIQYVPDAEGIDKEVQRFKHALEQMKGTNVQLKALERKAKEWNKSDTTRVMSSLTLTIPVFIALGPVAVGYQLGLFLGAIFESTFGKYESFTEKETNREHTYGESQEAILRAIADGAFGGLTGSLLITLMKKLTFTAESKLSAYFISFYREYYAALMDTTNALVEMADKAMDG